jgi:hypothetical protein
MSYAEFSISTQLDTKCIVQRQGFETTEEFSDILTALAYIRRQGCGEDAGVTCYDPVGRVMFVIGKNPEQRKVGRKTVSQRGATGSIRRSCRIFASTSRPVANAS